jgi:hypothetical protein
VGPAAYVYDNSDIGILLRRAGNERVDGSDQPRRLASLGMFKSWAQLADA